MQSKKILNSKYKPKSQKYNPTSKSNIIKNTCVTLYLTNLDESGSGWIW